MNRILDGLRVIEGSAFVAAPLGGMTLAQLGAEVIRFDPIGGSIDTGRWPLTKDGASLYWAGLNKGKRSIMLDIRADEGRALVRRLLAEGGPDGGILVTNFPGTGWLAYEALREARDDLIMVNLVGTREGGSAVDYTVNCGMGFPFATGDAHDDHPVNHMFPVWDAVTGLAIALSVLAAERHRRLTGEGQLVRLALADMALWMVGNMGHIAEVQINGDDRRSAGNHVFGAFGRDFATRDGRRVMIVAITRGQWRALVAAMGLEARMAALETAFDASFDDEGERYRARHAIAALIEPWVAARSLAEVGEALDAGRVLWGPYRTFRQLVAEDPRISADYPLFDLVEQPGIGATLAPGAPMDFSAAPRETARPAPALGADTDAVLRDLLGLDAAAIRDLRDRRIVA